LGTAGAIANIRPWLDGRGVLALNADTWTSASLASLVAGWDGITPRVLVVGDSFGPAAKVAGALVPWADVLTLPDTPSGLYEHCWAGHARSGNLAVVTSEAGFIDCGSPADYLRANLTATAGVSSVAPTATVRGAITRCVVWPRAHVEVGEVLTDAIRTTAGRTVLVRTP
jgi:NDP-sugar pyrophosphorylase family protein